MCVVFTNNSYADGGNQIWLKNTKRGINISCPSGFQYTESNSYICDKQYDSVFNISLTYNDLYVEEEFFSEKEIMKQAIISVKLLSNVKIIEKKTSIWFGKITADIKYERDNLKGLQKMIVFNDGTVIIMNHVSGNKGYDTADKVLSTNIKILEPNQVKELEKIHAEYTKQAQEIASKKQAEEYKKKQEQDKKESVEITESIQSLKKNLQGFNKRIAKFESDLDKLNNDKNKKCDPSTYMQYQKIIKKMGLIQVDIVYYKNDINSAMTKAEINDLLITSSHLEREFNILLLKFGPLNDYVKNGNKFDYGRCNI